MRGPNLGLKQYFCEAQPTKYNRAEKGVASPNSVKPCMRPMGSQDWSDGNSQIQWNLVS